MNTGRFWEEYERIYLLISWYLSCPMSSASELASGSVSLRLVSAMINTGLSGSGYAKVPSMSIISSSNAVSCDKKMGSLTDRRHSDDFRCHEIKNSANVSNFGNMDFRNRNFLMNNES